MAWTNEDTERLKTFRNIIDSDDIKIKQKIKEQLVNNRAIIHVLNNKELDEDEPDQYFGVNILPYYIINPTQHNVQNFICFTTRDEQDRYQRAKKTQDIVFVVLCEQKNIIDKETSLPRHDLLAALIMDEFNATNLFGAKIYCASNVETVVDDDYACRTLTFSQYVDNNIVRTKDSYTRIKDRDVVQ